jgi:hypothetical protein
VWTVESGDGTCVQLSHRLPDATGHPYLPSDPQAPIKLHRGFFTLSATASSAEAYDGQVSLSWLPTPGIEASGERPTSEEAAQALLDAFSASPATMWTDAPTPHLLDGSGSPLAAGTLPPAPGGDTKSWSQAPGTSYLGPTLVAHASSATAST